MDLRSYTYKHYLLTLALVYMFNAVWAQSGLNPFEVKPRVGRDQKSTIAVSNRSAINIDSSVAAISIDSTTSPQALTKSPVANSGEPILNPFDVDHIPLKKSLLKSNKDNINEQLETTKNSNAFIFWFLLLGAALLAIALNIRLQIISLITKSIFNKNLLKLFHREESGKNSLGLALLYIIFSINGGAFIYLVTKHYDGPQGILMFFNMVGMLFLFFMLKHLGLWLIGVVFEVQKQTSLYSFAIMNNNLFLGVILLPINMMIAYAPIGLGIFFIYLTLAIILVLLFLLYLRGLFIVSEYLIDGLFQIFIYLCTFELIPFIVLVKIILIS